MSKKIYELPCAHTKASQITRQKRLLWARHNGSEVVVSLPLGHMTVSGVLQQESLSSRLRLDVVTRHSVV
jgi:hypothetical protein